VRITSPGVGYDDRLAVEVTLFWNVLLWGPVVSLAALKA
jgi:hypothetical protein